MELVTAAGLLHGQLMERSAPDARVAVDSLPETFLEWRMRLR